MVYKTSCQLYNLNEKVVSVLRNNNLWYIHICGINDQVPDMGIMSVVSVKLQKTNSQLDTTI